MVFDCPEEQHVEGKYARELFYMYYYTFSKCFPIRPLQSNHIVYHQNGEQIHPKTNRIKSFFNFWSNFEGGLKSNKRRLEGVWESE